MNTDIKKLRKLVKNGEYLEENFNDVQMRNQWLYEIDDFVNESSHQREITRLTKKVRKFTDSKFSVDSFNAIMGFLRSEYNSYQPKNKQETPDVDISYDLQNVFIVHGHDNDLIEEVKACISELELNPIVLHEQPNRGLTIIEKLESYIENCKCAVILYTPCDLGKSVNEAELSERARQNVVYEHGLFQGALTRKRVILLKKGNTVLPGDNDGMVYTSVDSADWKEKLKMEIRAIDEPIKTENKSVSIEDQLISRALDKKGLAFEDHDVSLKYSYIGYGGLRSKDQKKVGLKQVFIVIATEMLDTAITEIVIGEAIIKQLIDTEISTLPAGTKRAYLFEDKQLIKRILHQLSGLNLVKSQLDNNDTEIYWSLTAEGKELRDDMILIKSTEFE